MAAATTSSPPKTSPHRPKALLDVTIKLARSYREGHQLEEEVGGLGLKRNVADFVNHQERIAAKPGEFGVDAPGVVSLGEPCYPFGGGGEQHPMTGLTRAYRQADRKMSLPGARRGPKTRRYRGR